MTINDQIRDERLQYDVNREAVKISALSSGKIHKYDYLTGEGILPSNQQQIIEHAKFNYSALGKAFEKQIKTIEDQGEKQVDALKDFKYDNKNEQLKMWFLGVHWIMMKLTNYLFFVSIKTNYSKSIQ